jgi:hypothetical protein
MKIKFIYKISTFFQKLGISPKMKSRQNGEYDNMDLVNTIKL